jgi:hypothetical protein
LLVGKVSVGRDTGHSSCDWNPEEFLAITHGLSGSFRILVRFTFATQCWALWLIHNKLIIEGKILKNPADVFFHISLHM